MEVAPRSGGNYIPQVIQYATGFDMLEAVILATMGEPVSVPEQAVTKGFWSYFAIPVLRMALKKIIIDQPSNLNISLKIILLNFRR